MNGEAKAGPGTGAGGGQRVWRLARYDLHPISAPQVSQRERPLRCSVPGIFNLLT